MNPLNRRQLLKKMALSSAAVALSDLGPWLPKAAAAKAPSSDSLAMQLYKSLTDEQKAKVCLPVDHPRRQWIDNWWYIHSEYRIPNTFSSEQQEAIQTIFDSLHSPEYIDDVKKQVRLDTYGIDRNAPAVGFFGGPENEDFEFIYTGHHVTRRCNVHSVDGTGFGGAPIFYGHYPHPLTEMNTNFHETPEHPGNPYWYQGKAFNRFVESLDGAQHDAGLVQARPRSEKPELVIQRAPTPPGLHCADLSKDQKQELVETMRDMMAMFRPGDIDATIGLIEKKNVVDRLHISWYDGKYDVGSDQVWDTWQIEGPDMVWYFRGVPHIHCYFHLKA